MSNPWDTVFMIAHGIVGTSPDPVQPGSRVGDVPVEDMLRMAARYPHKSNNAFTPVEETDDGIADNYF